MSTETVAPWSVRPPSPLSNRKPGRRCRSDSEETGVIYRTGHSHGDNAITRVSFPHETGLKLIKHAELFDNRSAILSFFFLRCLSHSAFNSHFPKEEKFFALPLLPACRTNQERTQILHITCCKLRRGKTKQHNPLPSSICSSGESSVNADNYNKVISCSKNYI